MDDNKNYKQRIIDVPNNSIHYITGVGYMYVIYLVRVI